MLVSCHNTTWYHNPEDFDLNLHHSEHLKSCSGAKKFFCWLNSSQIMQWSLPYSIPRHPQISAVPIHLSCIIILSILAAHLCVWFVKFMAWHALFVSLHASLISSLFNHPNNIRWKIQTVICCSPLLLFLDPTELTVPFLNLLTCFLVAVMKIQPLLMVCTLSCPCLLRILL
jgi:hypothetical protein